MRCSQQVSLVKEIRKPINSNLLALTVLFICRYFIAVDILVHLLQQGQYSVASHSSFAVLCSGRAKCISSLTLLASTDSSA
jgi:hypothetical protein